MPMATLLALHWTSSASSKSPSHWRNSAGITNCRIASVNFLDQEVSPKLLIQVFIFFFQKIWEELKSAWKFTMQTHKLLGRSRSIRATQRPMWNASVKPLEYYKESIWGLLSGTFLSHIHQLEMNFLQSWVLVLLKFSSNTYLYKSNNIYQQILQHEGLLRGKVVTSSWHP